MNSALRCLPDHHCRQNANWLNSGMQGAARSLRTAHRCRNLDGGFPSFQRPVWSMVAARLGSGPVVGERQLQGRET